MTNHTDRHLESAALRRADLVTHEVYCSDGSDGYTAGTWGWTVAVGGWSSPIDLYADGGFGDQASASAAGTARANALRGSRKDGAL